MTPSGIELATFRIVVQCLKELCHRVTCEGYSPYFIVICDFSCSTIFTALSQERHNFVKEVIEMCVLNLSTSLIWNISQSKKNWAHWMQEWHNWKLCISQMSTVQEIVLTSVPGTYLLEMFGEYWICCSSSTVDICVVYLCLTTPC